jgi:hypothetical protein
MKVTHYKDDPEFSKVQEDPQSIVDSRYCMYGIVPIDAIKTMDKRKFSFIADATLDEIVETLGHVFSNVPLCDNCEEPATRTGIVSGTLELACDSCQFSVGAHTVMQTSAAESIHRANALIKMLQDRRE